MLKRLINSEDGATMVEMTIAMTVLLALLLGFVDFGNAFYQWNAAVKAVEVGARRASITDPIAANLPTAGPVSNPGSPVGAGAYGPFVCTYTGCTNSGGFNYPRFSLIFRGDTAATGATAVADNDNCPALAANQRPGMCHYYPWLKRSNVVVTYSASGLGYQTRQGGPVPTITVSLTGVDFQFFFLSGLMHFTNLTMPSMLSTVTGEDLKNGP
jgi:Flp pilus assembly protein TadG